MIENSVWRTGDGEHRDTHAHFPPPGCSPVPCPHFLPSPPPQAAPQPQHCMGTGCHRLNLSAAAHNQKSHRSFPVNICGALSALAFPSLCSPSKQPPAPTWGGGGVPAAPSALQNASREKSEGFGAHREVCRAALCSTFAAELCNVFFCMLENSLRSHYRHTDLYIYIYI